MTPDEVSRAVNNVAIGKEADIILEKIMPLLEDERAKTINLLKGSYKLGDLDHNKSPTLVAELVVYDKIQAALSKRINKGRTANKEIENAGRRRKTRAS